VKEMAKLMKRKLHLYNSPLGTPGDANKNINTKAGHLYCRDYSSTLA
jgi:hypothetical protein